MKKYLVLVVLLPLFLCGCNDTEKLEVKKVTCEQKDEVLNDNKNAIFIDVRTEEEYKEGHLKDAINIPHEKVVEVLSTYGTIDFDTPIVVYCKSGGRSGMASLDLINAGYKNVYDLGAMSNCE